MRNVMSNDRVCDKCEMRNDCITYQANLNETDRILFGCLKIEDIENDSTRHTV